MRGKPQRVFYVFAADRGCKMFISSVHAGAGACEQAAADAAELCTKDVMTEIGACCLDWYSAEITVDQ